MRETPEGLRITATLDTSLPVPLVVGPVHEMDLRMKRTVDGQLAVESFTVNGVPMSPDPGSADAC